MARRGNAAASGFSGQRLHDVRADDRQRRADHIAHEGHPDADGDEQNGPGRFIGEVGQRIELVADVGGDGADKERGAEQEDQTLEGDGLGLGHIPHAQRAQEHGDEVAENDRRNVLEEFLHAALGAFLQRDENGCHKEQHCHM